MDEYLGEGVTDEGVGIAQKDEPVSKWETTESAVGGEEWESTTRETVVSVRCLLGRHDDAFLHLIARSIGEK